MGRWSRAFLIVFLALLVLLALAITFTIGWRPIIGPETRALTDRRFESTPARLARGEYLVRNVAGCLFCHSELDTSVEGLPVKAGTAGAGRSFAEEGIPFLTSPNITPDGTTGAGKLERRHARAGDPRRHRP